MFQKINDMFEHLPLAAVVTDKMTKNQFFCVHGGVGSSLQKIEDIERIQRPLKITLGAVNDQI